MNFVSLCMAGQILEDKKNNLALLCQALPGEKEPDNEVAGVCANRLVEPEK